MDANKKAKISLTKEDLKQLITQYKIMRRLLETAPKRKIPVSEEKEWHAKREAFLTKYPPVKKIYSVVVKKKEI